MPQTNLNKRLYEAIKSEWLTFQNGDEDFIQSTASACEKIVLEEKIDLLVQFKMLGHTDEVTYRLMIESYIKTFTEQLNNLP